MRVLLTAAWILAVVMVAWAPATSAWTDEAAQELALESDRELESLLNLYYGDHAQPPDEQTLLSDEAAVAEMLAEGRSLADLFHAVRQLQQQVAGAKSQPFHRLVPAWVRVTLGGRQWPERPPSRRYERIAREMQRSPRHTEVLDHRAFGLTSGLTFFAMGYLPPLIAAFALPPLDIGIQAGESALGLIPVAGPLALAWAGTDYGDDVLADGAAGGMWSVCTLLSAFQMGGLIVLFASRMLSDTEGTTTARRAPEGVGLPFIPPTPAQGGGLLLWGRF